MEYKIGDRVRFVGVGAVAKVVSGDLTTPLLEVLFEDPALRAEGDCETLFVGEGCVEYVFAAGDDVECIDDSRWRGTGKLFPMALFDKATVVTAPIGGVLQVKLRNGMLVSADEGRFRLVRRASDDQPKGIIVPGELQVGEGIIVPGELRVGDVVFIAEPEKWSLDGDRFRGATGVVVEIDAYPDGRVLAEVRWHIGGGWWRTSLPIEAYTLHRRADESTQAAPATAGPRNNDGRDRCYWCGSATREIVSAMSVMHVCQGCGK